MAIKGGLPPAGLVEDVRREGLLQSVHFQDVEDRHFQIHLSLLGVHNIVNMDLNVKEVWIIYIFIYLHGFKPNLYVTNTLFAKFPRAHQRKKLEEFVKFRMKKLRHRWYHGFETQDYYNFLYQEAIVFTDPI